MHEFCSHCDVRKTSLFEINQQLGDQIENLRAENENLRSQLRYYESSDLVDVVRCKDCKYLERTDCFGECSLWNDRGEPHGEMLPNDFCSYGKRRKEDGSIY